MKRKYINQNLLKVALYLRLSKEDVDKLNNEEQSESIKNQEIILKKYAEEQGWYIVGVYDDEDYSGSDRDRPNFNRMIEECKKGNVDIVLVKTQSRFARDMTLIDLYVHNKFKEWGVRFVTYIERIDNTRKETKKTSQITAMTDEWYLEDTSDNIRETLREKKRAGLFTGAFAPYGYIKDPDDKNHLIIDPIASEVIRKIFDLYNKGWGYYKIVSYLNEKRIPSPYDYKRKQGLRIGSPSSKKLQSILCISKKGSYNIINILENLSTEKITDIILIGTFLSDDINDFIIPSYIDLYVRKLDKKNKLYVCLEKKEIKHLTEEDLEKDEDWIRLFVGEKIPKDTIYIAIYFEDLNRLKSINYELEAFVNYNSKYYEYRYETMIINDDKKRLKSYSRYEKKAGWSDSTIASILRNEYYIGNTVQGKFKNISYKDQRSKLTPKEDWIIVLNTHESIIERDLWDSVQNRLSEQCHIDRNSGKINPLSKKVYCAICGKSFEKTNGSNHKYEYFVCRDKRNKWINCDNKSSIRTDDLEKIILDQLNDFIINFKDNNLLRDIASEIIDEEIFIKKINILKKELDENEKQKIVSSKYFQQLYEDKVEGIITESEFLMLGQNYKEKIVNLVKREDQIKEELKIIYSNQIKLKDFDTLFNRYRSFNKITIEMSKEWIEKIFIGKRDKLTNSRDIRIEWKF